MIIKRLTQATSPQSSRDEADRVKPLREHSTPRDAAQMAREPLRSSTTEEPEPTLGTFKNAVDSYMEALSRQSSRYKLPAVTVPKFKLEETGGAL